jgi:hypothetical protein
VAEFCEQGNEPSVSKIMLEILELLSNCCFSGKTQLHGAKLLCNFLKISYVSSGKGALCKKADNGQLVTQ